MWLEIGLLQILFANHLVWEGAYLFVFLKFAVTICASVTMSLTILDFQLVRNLLCVYSKKHMNDDPELVDMKKRANTKSLKEMALLLR